VIEGKTGLARVGERAREEGGKKEKDKEKEKEKEKEKFTNLFNHLRMDLLTTVYHRLNKSAAAGVDGQTWAEYGQGLRERLIDLQGRLHRGSYHPPRCFGTTSPRRTASCGSWGSPPSKTR